MRGYYLPLASGAMLAISAFLPRLHLGATAVGGVPAASGFGILALGLGAMLLATLSFVTRKNSRHPLLLVGLIALSIEILGWQILRRTVSERAWATAQATAIIAGERAVEPPPARAGMGLYLGLSASALIAAFGLTIVVKKVPTPYVVDEDDDV